MIQIIDVVKRRAYFLLREYLHTGIFGVLTLTALAPTVSSAAIAYVQGTSQEPVANLSSLTATFAAAQVAGDLNVVAVGWTGASSHIVSVIDTKGNVYVAAGPAGSQSSGGSEAIYYAKNITAAAAGTNTVTVTYSAVVIYPAILMAEYSGIDTVSPLDRYVNASGSGTALSAGPLTTTTANDLLIGVDLVNQTSVGGPGFTVRLTGTGGDIFEDKIVSAIGTYSATATESPADWWVMNFIAFKAAGSTGGGPSCD